MSLRFSVVIPVRNELDLLKRTLPSWCQIRPTELILCFDKPAPQDCVAEAERIAGETRTPLRIIEVERDTSYRFQQAHARRTGFNEAKNEIILTGDIDTVPQPQITTHIRKLSNDRIGLISFSKFSYPISFRYCVAWLIQKLYRHHSFTGLYAFRKAAWLETEDPESLKKIERGEDTHLHEAVKRKYRTLFVRGIKNLTLRPKESARYQFMLGWNRWAIRHVPLVRVLISSMIYFRPRMLVGYLKARFSP